MNCRINLLFKQPKHLNPPTENNMSKNMIFTIAGSIFLLTQSACDQCDTIENAETKAITDAENCEYDNEYRSSDFAHCDSLVGSVRQPWGAYDETFCEMKAEDCEAIDNRDVNVCD